MPPTKDFVENKEAMQQAIDNYNQINEWWGEYYNTKEGADLKEYLNTKLNFDTRDMPFYVAFMHGYSDKETFMKNLKSDMEDIKNNHYKALDKFMDKYENYDFSNIKTDTIEHCNETFLLLRLNQLPGNLVNWDKGYKAHRLGTVERQMKSDDFVASTTIFLTEKLNCIYREVGNIQEKTKVEDTSYLDIGQVEYEDNLVAGDVSLTSDFINGKSDSYVFPVPEYYMYYEEMQKDNPKLDSSLIEKYGSLKDDATSVIDSCIEVRYNNTDSVSRRNTEGISECFKYDYFIDGKCIEECVEHLENEKPYEYKTRANIYFANAIKEGKAIDIAKTYVVDGKANTQIIPLKPRFSDEMKSKVTKDLQEAKVKREHSWFRRTFFDWGPFRIKRDPNILENIQKQNEANKKERNEAILSYRNGKYLDLLNQQRKDRFKQEPYAPGKELLSKYDLARENKVDSKNHTLEEAKDIFKDYIKSKKIDEKNIDYVKHELSSLDKNPKTREIELKGITSLLKNRMAVKDGIIKHFGKIDDNKLVEYFEKLGTNLDFVKNKDDKAVEKLQSDLTIFKDMIKSEYPDMSDKEYDEKSNDLMKDVKGVIDSIAKDSGNAKAFEYINLIKDKVKDYDPNRLEKAIEKLENEPEKLQERIDVLKDDNRVQMDLSYIFDEDPVDYSDQKIESSNEVSKDLEL